MKRSAVGLIVALSLSLIAFTARAEDRALATELFLRGRELMAAGQLEEACEKFASSHQLDPSGGAILNLAMCHEERQLTATAWSEFREALSFARRDQRSDRIALAQEHIERLEHTLSRLRVNVTDADATVLRDGTPLPATAWGESMPIDPGTHVIEARAPGRISARVVVNIGAKADRREVTISLLRERPPPAVVHRTSPWTKGLGIGAVAGAAIGTVTGFHAILLRRSSDHFCTVGCSEEGVRINDRAKTWADISTVSFVATGAVAVATIISVLVASSESHR